MLKEIYDSISAYLSPILISVFSVVTRIFFEGNKPSLMHIVRTLIIAVFVGGLVGEIVAGTDLSPGWKGVIIAVSAMISDDIISVVISAGGKLREHPIEFLKELLPWYKRFK